MPLPKIATPSYELELPSTGKTIQYRPFLVKEEKLLVIALESEDIKQITNAIKAVIRACVLTKGIKVETLPTFDIEYLFLNIRGKSVGEDIAVNITCPDDEKTQVSVNINLDDIKVKKPDYILILAWNFASSIIKKNDEFKSSGGKFIIPLPEVLIV